MSKTQTWTKLFSWATKACPAAAPPDIKSHGWIRPLPSPYQAEAHRGAKINSSPELASRCVSQKSLQLAERENKHLAQTRAPGLQQLRFFCRERDVQSQRCCSWFSAQKWSRLQYISASCNISAFVKGIASVIHPDCVAFLCLKWDTGKRHHCTCRWCCKGFSDLSHYTTAQEPMLFIVPLQSLTKAALWGLTSWWKQMTWFIFVFTSKHGCHKLRYSLI